MPETAPALPSGEELSSLLRLSARARIDDLLAKTLMLPLKDLLSRPRKELRAEAVRIGHRIACGNEASRPEDEARLSAMTEVIELIHMGSLIVDDIQDESESRRGNPALHRRYGVPIALNAGNWLYFWPLKRLREIELPADARLDAYEECHSTLLRAHFGQALDVGISIEQVEPCRLEDVCLAAIELKSGALMALALKLGALAAGRNLAPELNQLLNDLGHQIGIALQMRDDLGNLTSSRDPGKRFEDLARRNPSFVWMVAGRCLDAGTYGLFKSLVRRLPQSAEDLVRFVEQTHLVEHGRIHSAGHWRQAWQQLQARVPQSARAEIEQLMARLMESYD